MVSRVKSPFHYCFYLTMSEAHEPGKAVSAEDCQSVKSDKNSTVSTVLSEHSDFGFTL